MLRGDKRPPLALGLRRDGTGVVRIGSTPGSAPLGDVVAALATAAPGVEVEVVDVVGPRVGSTHRGAGVAEVLAGLAVLGARADGTCEVTTPNGARASVRSAPEGIEVDRRGGRPAVRDDAAQLRRGRGAPGAARW